jgi:hypothetical protein
MDRLVSVTVGCHPKKNGVAFSKKVRGFLETIIFVLESLGRNDSCCSESKDVVGLIWTGRVGDRYR